MKKKRKGVIVSPLIMATFSQLLIVQLKVVLDNYCFILGVGGINGVGAVVLTTAPTVLFTTRNGFGGLTAVSDTGQT
ncbi:MAG: hypothetical protein MJZ86_05280 [Bacteroidales bacterium]|nr:hypothetical protein [Bacteroidales bacterium]